MTETIGPIKERPEQITVNTYNWGPCLIKVKARDTLIQQLREEAKKSKIDYRKNLAGIIGKEKGYTAESRNRLVPEMSKYLGAYDQMYQRYTNKPYETKPKYFLSALWINYQKQNEFNPPHDHDGALSFVVYLDVPEKLKQENAEYIGKSCGPGGIQFMYGEGNRQSITFMSHFPEVGDMFIFPAWLKHWVAPFQSKCTRISVSGNIHDSAALNTIPNDVTLSSGVDKDEKK